MAFWQLYRAQPFVIKAASMEATSTFSHKYVSNSVSIAWGYLRITCWFQLRKTVTTLKSAQGRDRAAVKVSCPIFHIGQTLRPVYLFSVKQTDNSSNTKFPDYWNITPTSFLYLVNKRALNNKMFTACFCHSKAETMEEFLLRPRLKCRSVLMMTVTILTQGRVFIAFLFQSIKLLLIKMLNEGETTSKCCYFYDQLCIHGDPNYLRKLET